jgi:hypothetical protein
MSEQDKRHSRALLYAIALLHLLCFGLVSKEAPGPTQGGSLCAMHAVSSPDKG